MRVTTTMLGGPVATMPSDQVDAEFSHLIWTNFSGPDIFHNRQRRHSALGYKTPIEYELASPADTVSA